MREKKKESNEIKIKFINHACFQFFINDYSFLIDPWFFGKVFNNSWSLFKDTNIDNLDIESVRYIFISHEHPDHLHFETLKKIKNINPNITIIFPYLKDKTVKNVIEKIGYKFKFIEQNNEKFFIDKLNYVKYFSFEKEGDHTMVFKINDKIIVNQNDDYTLNKAIKLILDEFQTIDVLMTQFSLAGYYGNAEEAEKIKKNGHDFHINRVIEYAKKFNPKIVVPFASYVYFCKDTNKYLNNFIVQPEEIFHALKKINEKNKCQLVYYEDEIIFNNDYEERNKINLNKLNILFKTTDLQILQSKKIKEEDLIDAVNNRLKSISLLKLLTTFFDYKKPISSLIKSLIKLIILSNKNLIIHITDINKIFELNFLKKNFHIKEYNKNIVCDLSLPSEDFLFMFKFPWGSDTVNISATANIYTKKGLLLFSFFQSIYKKFGIQV